MKKLVLVAILSLLATSFVTSIFAQKPKSKDELFKEIGTLSTTKKPEDMEKAYQLAKEFIVRFPKETSENAKKLKDFVKRYRENSFYKAFEDKKFADFFTIGKEILTDEPENIVITMNLGYGGYDAVLKSKDKSFGEDAIKYCQKTLQLLEAGNLPSSFAPFTNKEEAIAWMYYVVGYFSAEKDMKEAAINFYKSTLYESSLKKTSQPYIAIAYHYENTYEKSSGDLKAKVTAKTISDADFKTETDKINAILDQMIDAYARAFKLGEVENHPAKDEWKKRLTQIYLFRKKPEAGLEAFITYIVSTPLKDPSGF